MPYTHDDRKERIALPYVTNASELAFVVDKIAEELLWKLTGYDWSKLTTEHVALVDGALDISIHEFHRRIVDQYLDGQRKRNGDIFIYPHPEEWDISEEPVDVAAPVLEALEAS